MKHTFALLTIVASVAAAAVEPPAQKPILGTATVHGCYSSVGELQLSGTNVFNAQGQCVAACRGIGASVAASQGRSCYCGDKYPPAGTLVNDSQCDAPCPGFPVDACGGAKAFTIYNTGVEVSVQDSPGSSPGSEVTILNFRAHHVRELNQA